MNRKAKKTSEHLIQVRLPGLSSLRPVSHRPAFVPHSGHEPMRAASVPCPEKSAPRRRRKPASADVIAATVALKAVLPDGLLETFGCGQPATLVIQVPTACWCSQIDRAFFGLLDETRPTGGSPRQDICKFIRDGSSREHRPTSGNEDVVKAISERLSVVGISPAPKKFLPRTLADAPDFHVIVRPLSGAQAQQVIGVVTGGRARKAFADELVAGLDLADLAVAVRPGSTAADCERRLRRLAAVRTVAIGDDIPLLQDLSGCNAAKEYRTPFPVSAQRSVIWFIGLDCNA